LAALAGERPTVLACSALSHAIRDALGVGPGIVSFLIDLPEDEIVRRLQARQGHFFNPVLLRGAGSRLWSSPRSSQGPPSSTATGRPGRPSRRPWGGWGPPAENLLKTLPAQALLGYNVTVACGQSAKRRNPWLSTPFLRN
jgi:hypothetical protein